MSPIRTDRSDLPPGDYEGEPPDQEPRFVQLLVESMRDELAAAEPDGLPTAFGTRLRHSDAGKCARLLGYKALGLPPDKPMDLAGEWVTGQGRVIHQRWQKALQERYPEAQVEVKLRIDGLDASGHADAVLEWADPADDTGQPDGMDLHGNLIYNPPKRRILYELKSVGGYAYKLMIGERGPAQGPKYDHKAQAAMNGKAVDADEIIIGYLSHEAVSVNLARRAGLDEIGRFAAEWSYTRKEYLPWADFEAERMRQILELVDSGRLPRRVFPDPELPVGHEITDPEKGAYQVVNNEGTLLTVGTWWACNYCAYQPTCASTPPGRVLISEVFPDLAREGAS